MTLIVYWKEATGVLLSVWKQLQNAQEKQNRSRNKTKQKQ